MSEKVRERKKMSPLEELRHSTAHVMAAAILRLFPEAKIDIGPPTDTGFYHDFDLPHHFTAEDLEKIEAEMKKIIKENQQFIRTEVTREEARAILEQRKQPYTLERLQDIPPGEPISFYANGEFINLCAGTHVRYTKEIKAFKLMSVAGAYYRGDEKNKQMQRIYGTAFPSKEELETYLKHLEEAKNRDHRKIGKELKLYVIDDSVGHGLILWTPRGATLRKELQNFISEELRKQGYHEVFTPHIGKLGLYKTSGHYPYYKDSQFPPVVMREEIEKMAEEHKDMCCFEKCLDEGSLDGFLLKPMNCPMHAKIYASQPHSYRDLPVRLAEFGTVYRWEQSGELNGMTRVRGFTQDDAHLFCTPDQVGDEIRGCLHLVKIILQILGMKDYRVRVGLRDPDSNKYIGKAESWDKAEAALREAAHELGVPFTEEPGEAAFYGPKIDFVVRDVIGREWQLGTVQVDYNLPERFDLTYTGPDNKEHRPVMVHRAPFGSMERFTGVLIEHFGGNFPTWLAPEQVRILPLNDDLIGYAKDIEQILFAYKVRVEIDAHSDKLGAKIRRAEIDKIPYVLVVGAKEQEAGEVSVRSRTNKANEGNYKIDEFVKRLAEEIRERRLPEKF
ncbi:MAG: threonine--tRNA ligase [Verrucomicrobia bacterium]|nr:MAG: threonine--tRNA ligase [Verrucomicrobiota bacterium]